VPAIPLSERRSMEKEVMRERESKVAVCKGRRGDWMVDVTIDGHHQNFLLHMVD
jgi:hypothetical protein